MYSTKDSKHDVIDPACFQFSDAENVEQVANECGMRGRMLGNKLNPNQPHWLTASQGECRLKCRQCGIKHEFMCPVIVVFEAVLVICIFTLVVLSV